MGRKQWDSEKTEDSRQEYKKMQSKAKREVAKAKHKVYMQQYQRLNTK